MKTKFLPIFAACASAVAGVVMVACGGLGESPRATLRISIDAATGMPAEPRAGAALGSRTLTPGESWAPARYVVAGTGPGGAVFSIDTGSLVAKAEVAPGEWLVEAAAYSGGGKQVGAGSALCTLRPSQTTEASLTIYPLQGTGTLSIGFDCNMAVPSGSRIQGSLGFAGLPGSPELSPPEPVSIDIPAEQTSLSLEGVQSGYYRINLILKDDLGTVVAGTAESVFVLKGYTTSGTCEFKMGSPELDLGTAIFPQDPLPAPLLSVSHTIPRDIVPMPLAVPAEKDASVGTTQALWYLNGAEAGSSYTFNQKPELLPLGTFVYPEVDAPDAISFLRMDVIENDTATGRSGSGSVFFVQKPGSPLATFMWKGSYDYIAASGPSLLGLAGAYDAGTGLKADVKAVAAAPNGFIAIAGLDEDGAVHAFAAAYGAEYLLSPGDADGLPLPISSSWVRLWRDEIRIAGTQRTADRLALSPDGLKLAVCNSASNWIRLYTLTPEGGIGSVHDLVNGDTAGDSECDNIRALEFSADSAKLYALSNLKEGVFAFSAGTSGLALTGKVLFERVNASESLSMQDLSVSPSGSILASSSGSSRVYAVDDTGTSLVLSHYVEKAADGSGPYKPSSMEASDMGDIVRVLCNGSKIVTLSRALPSENYSAVGEFALAAAFSGATSIKTGHSPASSAQEQLLVAGGSSLGFLAVNAAGQQTGSSAIPGDLENSVGIDTSSGTAYTRGAFILGGGSSGMASVFGAE